MENLKRIVIELPGGNAYSHASEQYTTVTKWNLFLIESLVYPLKRFKSEEPIDDVHWDFIFQACG
jgi:hypothetical protein